MPLIKITAHAECEDCGKQIKLDLDPAQTCTTPFDVVEEAFSSGFEGGSNYEGRMRCHDCTSAYLDKWTAEHPHHISGRSRSGNYWMITTYADQKLRIRVDALPIVPEFDADTRPLLLWAAAADLLKAAREGLICAEADLEERREQCLEHGEDPDADQFHQVFKARRDLIAAAIAKAGGSTA